MKSFQQIFCITAIIALGSNAATVPVEPSPSPLPPTPTVQILEAKSREIAQTENNNKVLTGSKTATNLTRDLEASNSNQDSTYVLPEHHVSAGTTGSGNYNPQMYAGYLTPEAFQQYLAQFAGAFAPYGYPGYGPAPVYPAPYAVQTGYDGFLLPSPAATSLSASGSVSSNSGSILTALTNLIPALMESAIFRIVITVIGAVLMLLFGGAVTTAICNLTPLCDISFKAVTYLRGNGAAHMGRMVAEEVTPERVRRAAEIVRTAIRKYKEMQKVMAEEESNTE